MTITNKVTLKSLNAGLTPATDVPDAPTIGTATAGALSASVAFTAAATGGTPTSYTVTSSPGSLTGTGASSPITVSGLTGGTSYTFTVTATNSAGTSPASSASNSVTPYSPLGYESIATATVDSSGQGTITFSSIPQTYTHLQIRGISRNGDSTVNSWSGIRFNGDTGNNYSAHILYTNGVSASSAFDGTSTQIIEPINTAGNVTSGVFAATVLDIFDYTNTSKYKTVRSLAGFDNNGSGQIGLRSGLWMSTSAITSISIISAAGNLVQYSSFALYGIKG